MHRTILIVVLVAVFTSIGAATEIYRQSQRELTLEGNDLLSSQSLRVKTRVESVQSILGDHSATVLKPIDESGKVRAFTSIGRHSANFPVHQGRGFIEGEQGVALVGSQIELTDRNGHSYYHFQGHDYEVVGFLGRQPHSLLQHDVLLADRTFFDSAGDQWMTIDGPGAAERFRQASPDTPYVQVNDGTSRRTTTDYISPLILGLNSAIVLAGGLLTGAIAARMFRARDRVLVLMGRTPADAAFRSGLQLTAIVLVTSAVVTGAWQITAAGQAPLDRMIAGVLIQLPAALLSLTAAAWIQARSQ